MNDKLSSGLLLGIALAAMAFFQSGATHAKGTGSQANADSGAIAACKAKLGLKPGEEAKTPQQKAVYRSCIASGGH